MKNKQKITPCLWFDDNADEAVNFYVSNFQNSKIGKISRYGKEGFELHKKPEGSVMTLEFSVGGLKLTALNGGPMFKMNPSISFFYICETEMEIDDIWNEFSKDGMVMLPLDKYEWSEKYGFLQDKFGVSWQFALGKISDVGQKVTPSFLFVGEQLGNGEAAVKFYTSVFEDSEIDGILLYGKNEAPNKPGTVKHAQFGLGGEKFMLMEGAMDHGFAFNEGVSLHVACETQDEIDYFWDALTKDGEESQCGWLKDKFGVSWQIVPTVLVELLSDPQKAGKVTEAFLKMRKFDIETLKQA